MWGCGSFVMKQDYIVELCSCLLLWTESRLMLRTCAIFFFFTILGIFIDYQWLCGKFCFPLLPKTAQKLRTSSHLLPKTAQVISVMFS